ncbi:MAG: carbon monoxide dehydrogenase, partial [Pseudomonadota bacterium]
FQGMFTTGLEEGELVTEVKFPVPEAARYEKFIQPASRFPLVAAFVAKFSDGVRVAITGASSDGVFRWAEAEQALSGNWSADAVKGLATPDAAGMISDLHGDGAYRAHLVKVMTARAVAAA